MTSFQATTESCAFATLFQLMSHSNDSGCCFYIAFMHSSCLRRVSQEFSRLSLAEDSNRVCGRMRIDFIRLILVCEVNKLFRNEIREVIGEYTSSLIDQELMMMNFGK